MRRCATGFLSLALILAPAAWAAPQPVTAGQVMIDSFQFKPDTLLLKKGGKVTFKNLDGTPHTVTPETKSSFVGTGRLANQETKTVTFDTPGEYEYFCEIHPSMRGKITVVP